MAPANLQCVSGVHSRRLRGADFCGYRPLAGRVRPALCMADFVGWYAPPDWLIYFGELSAGLHA